MILLLFKLTKPEVVLYCDGLFTLTEARLWPTTRLTEMNTVPSGMGLCLGLSLYAVWRTPGNPIEATFLSVSVSSSIITPLHVYMYCSLTCTWFYRCRLKCTWFYCRRLTCTWFYCRRLTCTWFYCFQVDVYMVCCKTCDDGLDGSDIFPDYPELVADE